MVASFRDAVTRWLDVVLPADLYVRTAIGPGGGDIATLPTQPARGRARGLPGVVRAEAQRVVALPLDPRAAVGGADRAHRSPIRRRTCRSPASSWPCPPAMRSRCTSARPMRRRSTAPRRATTFSLPLPGRPRAPRSSCAASGATTRASPAPSSSIAPTGVRLTGDQRINDLALWLAPGASTGAVEDGLRRLASAARLRRLAARVRGAARDPRDLAAHLRPQLRRHLLAAGGGDRDRPVRHRRELLGAGAGAAQGVRPARRTSASRAARSSPSSPSRARLWTAVGAALGLALGIAVSVVLVQGRQPAELPLDDGRCCCRGRGSLRCALA